MPMQYEELQSRVLIMPEAGAILQTDVDMPTIKVEWIGMRSVMDYREPVESMSLMPKWLRLLRGKVPQVMVGAVSQLAVPGSR